MIGQNGGFGRKRGRNSKITNYHGRSLASDQVFSEKTGVNAENKGRNRREKYWFQRNSRRMTAITSACPKAAVLASMLC